VPAALPTHREDGRLQRQTIVASEKLGKAHLWATEGTFLSLLPLNSESMAAYGNLTEMCWATFYGALHSIPPVRLLVILRQEMTYAFILSPPWHFTCD
jgi:hypothetical protein